MLDSTGRRGNAKNKDDWKLPSVSTVKIKKKIKIKDFQSMIISTFQFQACYIIRISCKKNKQDIPLLSRHAKESYLKIE